MLHTMKRQTSTSIYIPPYPSPAGATPAASTTALRATCASLGTTKITIHFAARPTTTGRQCTPTPHTCPLSGCDTYTPPRPTTPPHSTILGSMRLTGRRLTLSRPHRTGAALSPRVVPLLCRVSAAVWPLSAAPPPLVCCPPCCRPWTARWAAAARASWACCRPSWSAA